MLIVYPTAELHLHQLTDENCPCLPRIEWFDQHDNPIPYPPLIAHSALPSHQDGPKAWTLARIG